MCVWLEFNRRHTENKFVQVIVSRSRSRSKPFNHSHNIFDGDRFWHKFEGEKKNEKPKWFNSNEAAKQVECLFILSYDILPTERERRKQKNYSDTQTYNRIEWNRDNNKRKKWEQTQKECEWIGMKWMC